MDVEKVIKGFECCHVMVHDLGPDKTSCGICPYKDVQTDEQIDLGGIECIAALHDDALALLKQEAVEPKWTSVKERYPENEGFYLVSADHGNYHPWIAEMKTFRGVKGFCNGAAMPCVGAWMPLPEPYNKGR